jgi:hypothetical protein
MFGKMIPFHGMNSNNIPPSKFFLVFTNTTTGGTKAFIKYDLNFNEITSRTYTQIGASTDVRSQEIYSPTNDDLYYYTAGDVNGTTSRITRWDVNLGMSQSTSFGSVNSRLTILDVGHPTNLISSNDNNIQARSKTPLTFAVTGTASGFVTTSNRKRMKLITDVGVLPAQFIVTSLTATRRYISDSTLTSFTQQWGNTSADGTNCIIRKDLNRAIIFDRTGNNASIIINLINGNAIGSSLSNFDPTIDFIGVYKNNDIVFYDTNTIIKRTYEDVVNDNVTDVFSFQVANVVYLELDEDENLYVVVAATTNGLRKYDKNGVLLLSANLPASGYSGKLVHK